MFKGKNSTCYLYCFFPSSTAHQDPPAPGLRRAGIRPPEEAQALPYTQMSSNWRAKPCQAVASSRRLVPAEPHEDIVKQTCERLDIKSIRCFEMAISSVTSINASSGDGRPRPLGIRRIPPSPVTEAGCQHKLSSRKHSALPYLLAK